MSASPSPGLEQRRNSRLNSCTLRATSTALGTPEILYLILLQVDRRALLTTAQRVCKAWHLQIRTTPLLRRRLFLHSPLRDPTFQSERSSAEENRTPSRKIPNPVLVELFPPWFDREAEDIDPSEFEFASHVLDHLVASGINGDYLAAHLRAGSSGGGGGAARRRFGESGLWEQLRNTAIYQRHQDEDEGRDNPFLRDGATWMQMQVSDPPTTRLAMYRSSGGMYWENNRAFCFEFPEGMRMGEFYRLVMASTRPVWYGYRLEVQWPPDGKITRRHVETACAQLGIATNKSLPERNFFKETGAMGADVLMIITRSVGCMAGVPRDAEEETQRMSGFDFFAEGFGEGFQRIEDLPWE